VDAHEKVDGTTGRNDRRGGFIGLIDDRRNKGLWGPTNLEKRTHVAYHSSKYEGKKIIKNKMQGLEINVASRTDGNRVELWVEYGKSS